MKGQEVIHQPFETWLLDEAELTSEQQHELREHLEACSRCAALRPAWRQVHYLIQSSPIVEPAAGFNQRWRTGMAERRVAQQRRQVRRFLSGAVFGSLVSLLLLVSQILMSESPLNLMVMTFRNIIHFANEISQTQAIALTWLRTLPPILPLAGWIIISASFSVIAVIWAISVWRISSRGVSSK
jgi:anti-sigma factor RsiW